MSEPPTASNNSDNEMDENNRRRNPSSPSDLERYQAWSRNRRQLLQQIRRFNTGNAYRGGMHTPPRPRLSSNILFRPLFRMRSIERSPNHRFNVTDIVPAEEDEYPEWIYSEADDDDDGEDEESDGEDQVEEGENSNIPPDDAEPSENTEPSTPINYDLTLPVEHSYLGGLDSVETGRHLFQPNSEITIKALYLNGTFLFPGQEIPLTFQHPDTLNFVKDIIRTEIRTFGIHIGPVEASIGTTAEIRSFSFKDENSVTIKVEGRQRFEFIGNFHPFRSYECKVRILPDIELCDFFRPLIQNERYLPISKRSFLTSYHRSALDHYDNQFLMGRLKSILMKIFESRVKTDDFSFPVDPNTFSYFVLMAIPFPDDIKARLLKVDCVNYRLRTELSLLTEKFYFQCSSCHKYLCNRDSFLVMSKFGTSGTFVNTHGIIHELYTFSSVQNVRRVSDYNEEFSWFPNYGWIIINCLRCHSHLGWEFQTKNPNINPKKFYALTKNSIRFRGNTKES